MTDSRPQTTRPEAARPEAARPEAAPSHVARPSAVSIESVIQQLRKEYADAGKAHLFEALQDFLIGEAREESYASAAVRLDMKEGAVRMSVLRMRRHFGYLLRVEIAQTVTGPGEVEAELRHLVASFAG